MAKIRSSRGRDQARGQRCGMRAVADSERFAVTGPGSEGRWVPAPSLHRMEEIGQAATPGEENDL